MRRSNQESGSDTVGFASDNPYLKEYRWDEVRDRIHALNPEFATIVDEIGPDDRHTVFLATYQYGDFVLKQSDFYLRDPSGRILSLQAKSIPESIKKVLGYNFHSNPIAMVATGSFELYVEIDDRVVPFALYRPGQLFGLWKIFDGELSFSPRNFPWHLTAGARSLFMVPKISERKKHQRLKAEYQINCDKPNNLQDHFCIFKDIANHGKQSDVWEAGIFFFSDEWFTHIEDDRWMKLNFYFIKNNWQHSSYWRNQFIWNIVFSSIHKKKSMKPSLYTVDIVKHVLGIACGIIPGMQPAINDDYAPIKKIQEAYESIYRLEYHPTIMQPGYFNFKESSRKTYYAMLFPTVFDLHLKTNGKTTVIEELYEVFSLLKKYLNEISSLCADGDTRVPYYKIANNVEFTAFHALEKNSQIIESSDQMIASDKNFGYSKESYPANASLFNGCIRMENL